MSADEFDVVVAGGGLVGASLGCALSGHGLRIGILEAALPVDGEPGYDDRVIALSLGSQRILAGVGVWDAVAERATPIRRIHVSERGGFGVTRLEAGEQRVPALGYVIPARDLGGALYRRLRGAPDVRLTAPARVVDFTPVDEFLSVRVEAGGAGSRIPTRLLVAADGGGSRVRGMAGIGVRERAYGQAAVIANVTPGKPHHGQAYERFTDTGPMALLPMADARCALVWTVDAAQSESMLAWDDARFLATLQERFGYRLGRFQRVGRRSAFPLQLVKSHAQVAARLVVIGNAAHTLHPVAGQGLNLGLRDVAALAQVVVDARRAGGDPGAAPVLGHYADWRKADQRNVVAMSDTLVRVFSNRIPPLYACRNLGLTLLDLVPFARRALSRHAMGLTGHQSRLSRGLPL